MGFVPHNYPRNTLQHHVTDVVLSISETWVLETRFATNPPDSSKSHGDRGHLRENLLLVYGHGSTSPILVKNNPNFGVPKIIRLKVIGN